jgi:hypothetical protein
MPNRYISETERKAKFNYYDNQEYMPDSPSADKLGYVHFVKDPRVKEIKKAVKDTKKALKDKRNDKEQLLNLFFDELISWINKQNEK